MDVKKLATYRRALLEVVNIANLWVLSRLWSVLFLLVTLLVVSRNHRLSTPQLGYLGIYMLCVVPTFFWCWVLDGLRPCIQVVQMGLNCSCVVPKGRHMMIPLESFQMDKACWECAWLGVGGGTIDWAKSLCWRWRGLPQNVPWRFGWLSQHGYNGGHGVGQVDTSCCWAWWCAWSHLSIICWGCAPWVLFQRHLVNQWVLGRPLSILQMCSFSWAWPRWCHFCSLWVPWCTDCPCLISSGTCLADPSKSSAWLGLPCHVHRKRCYCLSWLGVVGFGIDDQDQVPCHCCQGVRLSWWNAGCYWSSFCSPCESCPNQESVFLLHHVSISAARQIVCSWWLATMWVWWGILQRHDDTSPAWVVSSICTDCKWLC